MHGCSEEALTAKDGLDGSVSAVLSLASTN